MKVRVVCVMVVVALASLTSEWAAFNSPDALISRGTQENKRGTAKVEVGLIPGLSFSNDPRGATFGPPAKRPGPAEPDMASLGRQALPLEPSDARSLPLESAAAAVYLGLTIEPDDPMSLGEEPDGALAWVGNMTEPNDLESLPKEIGTESYTGQTLEPHEYFQETTAKKSTPVYEGPPIEPDIN